MRSMSIKCRCVHADNSPRIVNGQQASVVEGILHDGSDVSKGIGIM